MSNRNRIITVSLNDAEVAVLDGRRGPVRRAATCVSCSTSRQSGRTWRLGRRRCSCSASRRVTGGCRHRLRSLVSCARPTARKSSTGSWRQGRLAQVPNPSPVAQQLPNGAGRGCGGCPGCPHLSRVYERGPVGRFPCEELRADRRHPILPSDNGPRDGRPEWRTARLLGDDARRLVTSAALVAPATASVTRLSGGRSTFGPTRLARRPSARRRESRTAAT
jgi:hypothetical protein